MQFGRPLLIILVALGLSGCFTSKTPLIAARDAVFPFTKISYKEASSEEVQTMTREGNAYVMRGDAPGQRVDLRFKPVGGDLYVAQAVGKEDNELLVLYALLKVDRANNRVESYSAIGHDADVGPGLTKCGSNICLDNLDAYIAHARARIAAGAKPDATYVIVSTQ